MKKEEVDFNRFVNFIKSYTSGTGLTYEELSKKICKSNDYVKNVVNGRKGLSLVSFNYLCEAMNVPPTDFLKVKDNEVEPPAYSDDPNIVQLLEENNRLLREIIEMWRMP